MSTSSEDELPPLPATLLDTPWIKVNSPFYEDRWSRLRLAQKSRRPWSHVVPKDVSSADLILYVVRHGEGIHNVAADTSIALGQTSLDDMPYRFGTEHANPHFVDAPLTDKGRGEAVETGFKVCRHVVPQPKYLLVSPLQRATETGLLCWSHLLRGKEDGDQGGAAAATTPSRPAAAQDAFFPVVATDLCRESYHSRNICDLRRPLSLIRKDFPSVDYSLVSDLSAPLTSVSHCGAIPIVEDVDTVVDRAYDFLRFIAEREGIGQGVGGGGGNRAKKEGGRPDAVAVASHSVFILAMTQGVLHFEDEDDPRKGYFKTGEMRTFPIKFVFNEEAANFDIARYGNHRLSKSKSASRLVVRQLFEKESSTFTYIVYDSFTLSAVIFDPVDTAVDRDLQVVRSLRVRLTLGVNTHAHADHVTGTALLRLAVRSSGGPLGSSSFESAISSASGAKADRTLKDGDRIYAGERFLTAVATPGHTAGCMCFVADDSSFVLTGDALLVQGCGRTDFQGGCASTLYRSVHERLFKLPDDTEVYPAHDYQGRTKSTIGEEKRFNPRLGGGKKEEEFVTIMDGLGLPRPKLIDIAVPKNLNCGV